MSAGTPAAAAARLLLRLFIAGTSPRSSRTVEAVRQLRDAHLPAYELEIVDLYQQPQLAEADRVVAAPTLVRVSPGPARRVAGDLTDARRILQGLGLDASEGACAEAQELAQELAQERADERADER